MPAKAKTALACNYYRYYCFFSVLEVSLLEEPLADGVLLLAPLDGVLLAPLDGVLLEPLAALPLSFGWSALVLELELDAPPEAEAGGVAGVGLALDEELAEPDGLAGVLGVVVEPADDDEEPAGGVVRETARSPASRSQPAIRPAPSARETATARFVSFM